MACPACDGPGVHLGALGKLNHYRCRNCGMQYHSHDAPAEAEAEAEAEADRERREALFARGFQDADSEDEESEQ